MHKEPVLIRKLIGFLIGFLILALHPSLIFAQTSQAPPQRPLPSFLSAPPEPRVPVIETEPKAKPSAQMKLKAAAAELSPVPLEKTIDKAREKAPQVEAKQEHASLLVSVRTDKAIYKNGERVKIIGKIVNLTGDLKGSVVDLRIVRVVNPDKSPNWEEPDYRVLIEPTSSDFTDENYTIQLPLPDSGFWDQHVDFKVGAEATPRGGEASTVVITSFAAAEIGYLRLIRIFSAPLIIILLFIVLSLWVFLKTPTKKVARYALWVIYGSGPLFLLVALVGPLLISFSPGTEALLRTTPVGIAKVTTEKIKDLQWMMNIGGVVSDSVLKGGFAIPLFVLILSVVGGVISMLLKLPDFLRQYDTIPAGQPSEEERVSVFRSDAFKYFIYIITGPFLGAMFYSLLSLLDYTNAFALSIAAFSVGFISDRIVETILTVAGNLLDRAKQLGKGSGGG